MTKWHKLKKAQQAKKKGQDGYSPKQLKKMMKRGGMGGDGLDFNEIENVQKVVIYTDTEKLVLDNPENVTQMFLPQGEVFQIMGASTKVPLGDDEAVVIEKPPEPKVEISMADIQMVAQQTGSTPEDAEKALIENEGNIAKAIMSLK